MTAVFSGEVQTSNGKGQMRRLSSQWPTVKALQMEWCKEVLNTYAHCKM
jgi:hypothetical protein